MTESPNHDIELMERLSELYADLDRTPADVAAAILAEQLVAVGADAGFVATLAADGRSLEVARVTPYSDQPVRLAFPIDAPYPIAKVIRDQTELYIADNEQLRCDHPGLIRVKDEDHACATLPLLDDEGNVLGAMNLGFEDAHEFDADERKRIQEVAQRCTTALRGALARPR